MSVASHRLTTIADRGSARQQLLAASFQAAHSDCPTSPPVQEAPAPPPVVVRRVKGLSEADAGRLRQVLADLTDLKHLVDQAAG